MEEFEAGLTRLRRTLSAMEEDVSQLSRKKAAHEDLEAIGKRIASVETETREKTNSLASEVGELRRAVNTLVRSVDSLTDSFQKDKEHRATISTGIGAPSATLGNDQSSVWERIPKWCYLIMGIGILAIIQQGPGVFLHAQGISIPGVN